MAMTLTERDLWRRHHTSIDFLLSSRKKLDGIIEKHQALDAELNASYARWHGGSSKPIADITDEELQRLNRLLKSFGDRAEPLQAKYKVQRMHFEQKVFNANQIFSLLFTYKKVPIPHRSNPHEQLAAFFSVIEHGGQWIQNP